MRANESESDLFKRLKVEIDTQLKTFVSEYVARPRTGLVGEPLPESHYRGQVEKMKKRLIDPVWIEVAKRDTNEEIQSASPRILKCVALTDPEYNLQLAYSPELDDYLLAQSAKDMLTTIGIYGDPVDCYISM